MFNNNFKRKTPKKSFDLNLCISGLSSEEFAHLVQSAIENFLDRSFPEFSDYFPCNCDCHTNDIEIELHYAGYSLNIPFSDKSIT